jgi:energy-coupling factor transporter ATP-binding protein EcfA2
MSISLKKEEINAIKITSILKNIGTECAQKYLENEIRLKYENNIKTFYDDLFDQRGKYKDLNGTFIALDKANINNRKKNYPDDLHIFDISACFSIASYVLKLETSTLNSLAPNFDDLTPPELLNQLRVMRNDLAHLTRMQLDDKKYNEAIKNMKLIVKGLSISDEGRTRYLKRIEEEIQVSNKKVSEKSKQAAEKVEITEEFLLSNVPCQSSYYYERQVQIDQIKQKFKKLRRQKLVVLHGIAGIGKSTLAKNYAQMFKNTSSDHVAIWIEAEKELKIKNDYLSILDYPKIKDENDLIHLFNEKIARLVKNRTKIMIVYDNVEDYDYLKVFLRDLPNEVEILATMKNINTGLIGKERADFYETIEVKPFDEEEFNVFVLEVFKNKNIQLDASSLKLLWEIVYDKEDKIASPFRINKLITYFLNNKSMKFSQKLEKISKENKKHLLNIDFYQSILSELDTDREKEKTIDIFIAMANLGMNLLRMLKSKSIVRKKILMIKNAFNSRSRFHWQRVSFQDSC